MKLSLKNNHQAKSISGWGKSKYVDVEIISPRTIKEIQHIIINSKPNSIIARGTGRSYGDAAQLKEGKVIELKNFKEIFPDFDNNEVTAQAGATLEEILKIIIPKGFFLPVTPGTKKITLGGAIAADVHGKNHHKDGSFGNHVKRISLINGIGKKIILDSKKDDNLEINEQFWATIGGMGLTGIIIDATFSIIPIETAFIQVETTRCRNFDELMIEMIKIDSQYTVGWIDSMSKNLRGILTSANHAKSQDIINLKGKDKLSFQSKSLTSIPDIIPVNLMSKIAIKIFNEWWFRKYPNKRNKKIVTIDSFFYPLDKINNWNNIYGKNGFIQYQIVVPDEHRSIIKKMLVKLKKINALTFLPILKRLGPGNHSYLSFPISGWTLSVDLPTNNKEIEDVLKEIDKEIANIGGRIYLAKDSRQSESIFKRTYRNFYIWQKQKQLLDPRNIFISDIAKRLNLCN